MLGALADWEQTTSDKFIQIDSIMDELNRIEEERSPSVKPTVTKKSKKESASIQTSRLTFLDESKQLDDVSDKMSSINKTLRDALQNRILMRKQTVQAEQSAELEQLESESVECPGLSSLPRYQSQKSYKYYPDHLFEKVDFSKNVF